MQTYNVFYLVSGDDENNQNMSDTTTLSFTLFVLFRFIKKDLLE